MGYHQLLSLALGEITIIALDFSLISSLSFTSILVPLVDSLVFYSAEVRSLIGPITDTIPPSLTYTSHKGASRELNMEGIIEEQKVHILLWLVVCGMLQIDKGSRVST